MPPKRHVSSQAPSTQSSTTNTTSSAPATTSKPAISKGINATSPQDILADMWRNYNSTTPQRVKLIDTFMGFLVLVGVLQFVYCVVAGNYPFNAFISGFSATVGQFVLTASLRIQTNPDNRDEFKSLSHER
ncbi:oligosaccharyltransferase complex subunit epsilon, partial [Sticta canariensis]|nr:oligosaccharyltransferase complex subunit epsilon [Sticta canariensis]